MNTNLYLIRHYKRIDDSGADNRDLDKQWNTKDSKKDIFSYNPYLSDKYFSKINKINDQIANIQSIDIIITSPFLRCLETSLIMMDKINQIKNTSGLENISDIYVDFGLCEFIDDNIFYDVNFPYSIMNVYNNSICHLNEKNITIP